MLRLEAEVDTSGQGFFVWLDAKTIFTLVQNLVPYRAAPGVAGAWGIMRYNKVALGMGVSAGKGRFKLILDILGVGVHTLAAGRRGTTSF